jgi:hypothetical protein
MVGERHRDDAMNTQYTTIPVQAALGTATVSLGIAKAGADWELTALFSRRPPTVPIDAAEVGMAAFDSTGSAMAVRQRPAGLLTEAGGSLATTVNAPFRFAGARPPAKVVVQWAGGQAIFEIHETGGGG